MGVKGMKDLRGRIRHISRNLQDEVEKAVAMSAETGASEARSGVLTGSQVWTGNLAANIRVEKEPNSRYKIVADVPYAAFVEFGTGPRGDPTAPLKFQFGAPEHTPELTREITAWVMSKPAFFGPRTEEMGWAIARSISEHGTNPHPYMRPAWFTTKPIMLRRVRQAVKRVTGRA